MLGPGRLSIDARLFGWKRIDLPGHKKQFEGLPRPERLTRKGNALAPCQVVSTTLVSRRKTSNRVVARHSTKPLTPRL